MIIEKLKKEDIKLYKDLIDKVFDGSEDIDKYNGYNENSDKYEIIVTKCDDKIVGSITLYKIDLFTFSFQPCIEIFNVSVLVDYRNKGIAKNMFEYVFKYAKENGYKQVFLTCLDSAVIAHHLYESVGFKKMNSLKYSKNID